MDSHCQSKSDMNTKSEEIAGFREIENLDFSLHFNSNKRLNLALKLSYH